MAKKKVFFREPRGLRTPERARLIRDRYARALRLGWADWEAAAIANKGEGEIPLPGSVRERTAAALAEKLDVEPLRPVVREDPQPATVDDIPPNWQDLPWPQLRELAERFTDKYIKSRGDAHKAIENALGS